jgi:hypothetical protein
MYSFPLLALLALATVGRISAQASLVPLTQLASDPTAQSSPAMIASSTTTDDQDADDGDRIFGSSLKASLEGVDVSKLTSEHEVFIEDAMAFAYNKVHKNSDKYAISSHLSAKQQLPEPSSNALLRGAVVGSCQSGRTKYDHCTYWPSNMWYWYNFGCHYCCKSFGLA